MRCSVRGWSPPTRCRIPDAVPISLTVNGEVRQNSNTSKLIYNCRRLIEFASSFYTLYPGDLLYTGTPEGVGPVKPGDVIVCRSARCSANSRSTCGPTRSARRRRAARPRRKRGGNFGETFMLEIKRAGHSTLTTPDHRADGRLFHPHRRFKPRGAGEKPRHPRHQIRRGSDRAGARRRRRCAAAVVPGRAGKRSRRSRLAAEKGRHQERAAKRHHARHRRGGDVQGSQRHHARNVFRFRLRRRRTTTFTASCR